MRTFEGVVNNMRKLRERWFNYFEFLVLGHDIIKAEDLGDVIDTLVNL